MSNTFLNRSCTLCGPDAPKKEKYPATFDLNDLNSEIFSARRRPDRVHLRIVECESCQMLYSDPAIDPELLSKLYCRAKITYQDLEKQIYNSYAPILDQALPFLKERNTFLEIGGGSGFLLQYGFNNGFLRQTEVEPSEDGKNRFVPPCQNAKFIHGIFQEGSLPKESVSLACFFQVLDHVPNPRAFLEAVYQSLEKGGAAVCVTHDTTAFSSRFFGERSPIFDIEHTYLFNSQNLPSLFRSAGFQVKQTKAFPNRYAFNYWLNLLPVKNGLKESLKKTAQVLRVGEIPIQLYAGNVGLIAIKE